VDFAGFAALTFDCYGTLVDWESGLLAALRPILRAHARDLTDQQLLELYGDLEPRAQHPYQPYRQVLACVVRGLGERLGFQASQAEAESLAASLPGWPLFPDTRAALQRLKARYRLAIVSNIDDDLFAGTARHLGIEFDAVITAQQARAYKPSPAPFLLALERLRLPRERVLHVGQSVFHDVAPARSLGLATVLVTRRGFGATRPSQGEPDLKLPDLETLAALALPPQRA